MASNSNVLPPPCGGQLSAGMPICPYYSFKRKGGSGDTGYAATVEVLNEGGQDWRSRICW